MAWELGGLGTWELSKGKHSPLLETPLFHCSFQIHVLDYLKIGFFLGPMFLCHSPYFILPRLNVPN